ncbi:titin-like isoform X2 [Neocloeon triangulifer]|nr:titin-like isoform X2 [Neocloeon triangulifer]
MATDVGQLPPLPSDACDVEQINDEDLLRRMWQAAEDFGRKKEIRARMYKLREKRLREFYTTGEVLKDVQSADPHAADAAIAIREETPKRGGTTYRELVVGELRAGDLFDVRCEKQPAELIQSADGAHETAMLVFDSRTVVCESGAVETTRTTTVTVQQSVQETMLDRKKSPPSSQTSSRRSSKSSPTREPSSRKNSEAKITTAEIICRSSSESKETSSSRRSSETKSPSPLKEIISSRRSSDAKSPSPTKENSSRRSSVTKSPSPIKETVLSRRSSETKSPIRDSPSSRKSSISERKSVSPEKEISVSRKSSVSNVEQKQEEDVQFSTFTSVTLVRQQEQGSRVTSPNRRKLSSAGSKARRAGTPSASPPPCENEDDSSDDEVTKRSKSEEVAKPKSILRTPEQRKKSVTDEVKPAAVSKPTEVKEVKRAVAEVKLESSRKTEVTTKVENKQRFASKEAKEETKKETRTIRRRSREQVEQDSSERDSSCSPVRTRTQSKSKVSPRTEVISTTVTTTSTTSTLKRPTKLPMLNNKSKQVVEEKTIKQEDRCCGRRHGASSPDKPWRQSALQSPKKVSPTTKTPQKAHRSPSTSPERPAQNEKPARRPLAQKTLNSPTKSRTVESTIKRNIVDRAATTTCVKTPERIVTSRVTARSATSPIKPETTRTLRKPAETITPVKKIETLSAKNTTPVRKGAIPTYQRTQAARNTTTTTTTSSTVRLQNRQNQQNVVQKNGRSLSGSKVVEKAVPKEAPKPAVISPPKEPAPEVTISKPVESEEESAGFSTEEDETVTELEDIRYSSANLLDTEDEESSSRRLLAQNQPQIQQLSRDSSPEGRPQRFADRVSEPESDFETTKRERTPLEVVVPQGGLDGLQEEEEQEEEPALLSVADKANIFLTTDLSKVEKKKQTFETNQAVSLAKAVFERTDDAQEEARKKYERDILSRPSVFSKVTDRIRNFDQQVVTPEEKEKEPLPRESPPKEVAKKEEIREPVVEEPIVPEKVIPSCEEQPKASVSRASGKFGVTLRRTSSRLSDIVTPPKEEEKPKVKVAAEKPIEEITDVKQLEIMLEKATNYDERRRLRAAIRDAKKTQTIFTTTSTAKVTSSVNVTRKTSPTRQVNGRRSVSPVKSESGGRKNSSPVRKQSAAEVVQDGNAISSPLRAAPEEQQKPELVKQLSTGKLDKGKLATFQREENTTANSVVSIKRKVSSEVESARKISAPPREANPTDSVTSSYGVGPLDESGRPLFGLRALRRTQEPAPVAAPAEVEERTPTPAKPEVTDLSGRPLFGGLKALKSQTVSTVVQEKETFEVTEDATMPELQPSTGQLKSLVERHEQNTKVSGTSVSPTGSQKPRAKLRDSFVTQESRSKLVAEAQKVSKVEALVNRSERSNSLKAIIKKHENTETTSAPTAPAAVEPQRKISTEQVKSILKKPREATPEATVVSSATISLRKDSIERRPGDVEQESVIEDEDGGRTVVKNVHRERNEGDLNTTFSATSRSHVSGDGSRSASSHSSTTVTTSTRDSPISMARVGRSGSVRALQQKFQQTAMESPEPRSFPKAGLIFRTSSFKNAANGENKYQGGDSKEICEDNVQRTEQVTEREGSVDRRVTETRVISESSSNSQSFLGNNTKVTGVQDVLTRMRQADNNHDEGLSAEDREAKALLNKFLGASVLMQGIEPLLQAQSSALVSQVEKQRLAIAQEEKSTSAVAEDDDDVDALTDQAHLRKLLDAATDYDTRRKIRARLRTLMTDNKVTDGGDGVSASDSAARSLHGEFAPSSAVDQLMATLGRNFPALDNNVGGGDGDGGVGGGGLGALQQHQECDGPAVDSGTESGEDPRTPNSQSQVDLAPKKKNDVPAEVLEEVLGALSKLQGTLQTDEVDPARKDALLELVARLQGTLPVAPQPAPRRKKQRSTIGVSEAELAGARRLADEVAPFSPLRPSDFLSKEQQPFEAHDPITALTLKRPLHRRSFSQGRTLIDDDPSRLLFTPEQSVQIAVHKAAINKQISQEEDRRSNQDPSRLNREGSIEAELDFETKGCEAVINVPKRPDNAVILRTKSMEEGTKQLAVFQPQDLRAPEMVKNQESKINGQQEKPVDLPKPKAEIAKAIFPKVEPISKPIFATQDPPKPVFSKQELPKPKPVPQQAVQEETPPKAFKPFEVPKAFKPFETPKAEQPVPPVAKSSHLRAPSEPPKPPAKPLKSLVFELEAPKDEEPKTSGVLWGSICQSVKELHSERKIVSRAEKKRKLKRANTIDIPKPFDTQDLHDSEEDEELTEGENGMPQKATLELPFVPKTENDRKFLAFLERKSPKENAKPTTCAPGGHQWNNRFSNLKTNFEKSKEPPAEKPVIAKEPEKEPYLRKHDPAKTTNREIYEQKRKSSLPAVSSAIGKREQLPWAGSDPNVVVGSLTVAQNVQQKKQMFTQAAKPPMIKTPRVDPTVQKEEQLMELQRQQQIKYMQQKEEQERYRRLKQENERIRAPAPTGRFNHAQNSAFRPIAKKPSEPIQISHTPRVNHSPLLQLPLVQEQPPQQPRIEYSASVATETRQLNMRIFKDKNNQEEKQAPDVLEVAAPLTMMTAVSRVKEGPRAQQASVVHGQVQHRESPSRSSLAKNHLRGILPRDDSSPGSLSLTRSSHSTSDMLDAAFQARFDVSAASSRCSSIRPESPSEILSLKFEFPLHQASPLPFSPPTQRRTFDSPLRKSESSHQLGQRLSVPSMSTPTRRSPSGAKVHLFSKQFEAQVSPDSVEDKQRQVMAYLSGESPNSRSPRPLYHRQDTLRGIVHADDLENVDEEFERLFESAVQRPRQPPVSSSVPCSPTGGGKKSEFSVKTSSSTSTIQMDGGTKITSVSSMMTSNARVSKAPPSKLKMSPFDKFRQLDEQNSSPSPSTPKTPGGSISGPLFKFTDPGLNRSASNVKERLLYWCQVKTKEYKDLKIENFSTSWNNGMAFCALIHHFCPDAFNYEELRPENRRKNFELAFRVAEEKADIAPLLDVDDMVMMKKPDWKCVFTYVQSIYRRFKDEEI